MRPAEPHTGHHVVPLRTYVAVGAALFVLTALTVLVARMPLGGWNAVAAFGIAALKTALVALFFMHLYYDRKIYLLVFLAGLLFLAVFIAFTMFDVLRRADLYEITATPIEPNAAMYSPQGDAPPGPDSLADSVPAPPVEDAPSRSEPAGE